MHDIVAGISNKNGFELYGSIYNSVGAIPANAEFAYDQYVMQLVPIYASEAKHLKDLYEFRVVLNQKKVNEYKKEIGKSQTIMN